MFLLSPQDEPGESHHVLPIIQAGLGGEGPELSCEDPWCEADRQKGDSTHTGALVCRAGLNQTPAAPGAGQKCKSPGPTLWVDPIWLNKPPEAIHRHSEEALKEETLTFRSTHGTEATMAGLNCPRSTSDTHCLLPGSP